MHQLTDYSRGQMHLAVLHSRLLNCSAVQLGIRAPNTCETLAVLSLEHHALAHHPCQCEFAREMTLETSEKLLVSAASL